MVCRALDKIRSSKMKLSLVLSTHDAQFQAVAFKGNLEANVAKIAGWGYDGVELAIRDPCMVDAESLVRIVAAHALAVPAIGTGQAWGEERLSFTSDDPAVRAVAVERIKNHIPLAARLHAVIILGLIRGITPKGQTHAQSMAYLVAALQECATVGAKAGVRFALEPLNRYETDLIHTVAEGLSLIERVGAPNLGLLLDTFHMNIEEPSLEDSICACGDRCFHVHVADSNRWYPGAGHINFKHVLDVLAEVGYNGYVSGEFMPKPDADTAGIRAIEYLATVMPR